MVRVISAGAVNWADGWDNVWSAVESAAPGLTALMTTFGVILVAWAVAKFAWDKRKGQGGGDTSGLSWTLALGALLSAPAVLMPIILRVAEWIVNAVIGMFG